MKTPQTVTELFDLVREEIEDELGVDIRVKCRELDYIAGRNMFVRAVYSTYKGKHALPHSRKVFISMQDVAEYLGRCTHSITKEAQNRDWIEFHKDYKVLYKRIIEKYSRVNSRIMVLNMEKKLLLGRIEDIELEITKVIVQNGH